jgi:hypothetical protein
MQRFCEKGRIDKMRNHHNCKYILSPIDEPPCIGCFGKEGKVNWYPKDRATAIKEGFVYPKKIKAFDSQPLDITKAGITFGSKPKVTSMTITTDNPDLIKYLKAVISTGGELADELTGVERGRVRPHFDKADAAKMDRAQWELYSAMNK